jgi:hypothetical protein
VQDVQDVQAETRPPPLAARFHASPRVEDLPPPQGRGWRLVAASFGPPCRRIGAREASRASDLLALGASGPGSPVTAAPVVICADWVI